MEGITFNRRSQMTYDKWVVFSDVEVGLIEALFQPILGDCYRDQGMGRIFPAWQTQLSRMFREMFDFYLRFECFEPNVPRLCVTPL